MRYPGGKNAGGAYQNIINLIPPHRVYVEPFAGSAAVWRKKRRAEKSILIDKDRTAVQLLSATVDDKTIVYCCDAMAELSRSCHAHCSDTFIYCDPPYLPSTRVKKNLYEHEMTQTDHIRLLEILNNLASMVAISGYPSAVYDKYLQRWNRFEYDAMTRGGTMRRECIWYNYDTPTQLHDYRYLGGNRTERQRIRRKVARWQSKLSALPGLERNAILAGIQQTNTTTSATVDQNNCGGSAR